VGHPVTKPLNFYLHKAAALQSLPMVFLSFVLYLSKAVAHILNSAFLIGIFFLVSCSEASFGLGSLKNFSVDCQLQLMLKMRL
jgi:hypothetical protein